MDNNFSDILNIFKRLDEGRMGEIDAMFNDWMNSEDRPLSDMAGDDRAVMGCATSYLHGKVDPGQIDDYASLMTKHYHGGFDEGTMAAAEKHKSGSKFGGYWAGTDSGTPDAGEGVGGCAEAAESDSLESRLRARWEETKRAKGLQEYGMTTGGMSTGASTPSPSAGQTADPQTALKIKTGMQSLKSKIPDLDVNKSTAALTKADADVPLASVDQQALTKSLAEPISDLVKDPQLAGQLKQLIDKGQLKDVAQQKMAQQTPQGGTV